VALAVSVKQDSTPVYPVLLYIKQFPFYANVNRSFYTTPEFSVNQTALHRSNFSDCVILQTNIRRQQTKIMKNENQHNYSESRFSGKNLKKQILNNPNN